MQSCIKIGMKLYKELRLQGNHCQYTFIESEGRKWQSSRSGKSSTFMLISRPWQNHVQSFIKIGIKLYEELRSQVTHCLYTFIESEIRKWQWSQKGKSAKVNPRIISKPHAHLQTMGKTCVKFQKGRYKIVWGVALTRYLLSQHLYRIWGQKMTKFPKWKNWQQIMQWLYPNHMHIFRPWRKHVQSFKKIGIKLYEELSIHVHWGRKMTKFTNWKKWQKNLTIISKPHAHPHTMRKTPSKFQKDWYKTVREVALTRYPG